ncbi:gliding motility-associated peptidyl-prolyl isomerase GldI [Flavobacterium granuli]|uniref:Peptidyl-prolyl cis-trans isomerase n=1 Tax=Flavobacterium granuli TaxID=280093 RepID=A0A1M5IE18_9FLAO|nr:gliding motility-associated peptidyl-prolyl isomerase GldI [Flavobacterium granuli]PRZ27919.1 protein involved in gliding motility GldI [Flavobacterium granuli]SHG26319.1 protein involved in gliding motility GldI [Flavobacterium granuli]
MKLKLFIPISLVLASLFLSCKQDQEARRPISHSSGSFMKKSVDRNKKLVASEEDQIKAIIKSKPTVEFFASTKGYWYSYETKNELDTLTPKKGDIAFFDYEIKDLKGNIIYSQLELRPQIYRVDKQDIMMGLRDGIKLMRKNETVNFLFPSHMGYGYHGDDKKIGVNQPLFCTVTLHDFKPEAVYKAEIEGNTLIDAKASKKTTTDTLEP